MSYCTQPPPEYLEINNKAYKIETDFYYWAVYFEDFINELDDKSDDEKELNMVINEMKDIFFLDKVREPINDIVKAMVYFYGGYPKVNDIEPKISDEEDIENHSSTESIINFKIDLNLLIIAIRNQSGIDLTHRGVVFFHWWDFLLEVSCLTEDHRISQIICHRAYNGKDEERLKIKEHYRLPKRQTKAEKKILQGIDEIFYNS